MTMDGHYRTDLQIYWFLTKGQSPVAWHTPNQIRGPGVLGKGAGAAIPSNMPVAAQVCRQNLFCSGWSIRACSGAMKEVVSRIKSQRNVLFSSIENKLREFYSCLLILNLLKWGLPTISPRRPMEKWFCHISQQILPICAAIMIGTAGLTRWWQRSSFQWISEAG